MDLTARPSDGKKITTSRSCYRQTRRTLGAEVAEDGPEGQRSQISRLSQQVPFKSTTAAPLAAEHHH